MLSMQITDIKHFMNMILREDAFDSFYLCEASLKTGTSYHIDGKLNKDFYSEEEWDSLQGRTYSLWQEQKSMVFQMIKGQKLPVGFKLVFMLSPENTRNLLIKNNLTISPSDIAGLFFNIIYDNRVLSCTSGTSLKIFTMDKTLEYAWEANLLKFFRMKGIDFEEL
ncbi:MAG: DUF5721 family protein [Lachnospiraceae bacterium]